MKQCSLRFDLRPFPLFLIGLLALMTSNPGQAQTADDPRFVVANVNGMSGDQIVVPVQVAGFSNIHTFQFSFHWDSAQAAFMDVEQLVLPGLAAGSFGVTDTNNGALRVSWDDLGGESQDLADGAALFAVRLKLTAPNGSASSLFINGSPLTVEVSTIINEQVALANPV